MPLDLRCEWEAQAILGEGPLWIAEEQALYWVDIVQKQVLRLSVLDGTQQRWGFDVEVTSLAKRQKGGFVGTIRDGFAFIDLSKGEVSPIELPEVHLPDNRFNDGKIDSQGRFWAGSMNESGQASGRLYCLAADLSLRTMDEGYLITNGPAFSTDGKTLYHTDSIRREIYAFDLAPTGEIGNKRVFIRFEDEAEGSPDGMTVDAENCLWVCHFGGARISRFAPTGELLQVIPMPCPNITSCTFGGDDLDTLYITTARLHISKDIIADYPQAGNLFSCKVGVRGLPTPAFGG